LNNAVNITKDNGEKLAVIATCSLSSFEHVMPAAVIPIPTEKLQILEEKK